MHAARLRPRGLPQRLPAGERLLWQGAPAWRTLIVRAFHWRIVSAYFALIIAWWAWGVLAAGEPAHAIEISLLRRIGLAAVPVLLTALYAWAIQRSTIYSITTKRVVISFGMALPMTFNIPFSRIAGAGLRLYPDGAGDIPLQLMPDESMSYLVLWPHVRPWRMARAEPMLRCVKGAGEASAILAQALASQALAAEADLPHTASVPVARPPRQVAGQRGMAQPAAA
jgi:hypothetical protein